MILIQFILLVLLALSLLVLANAKVLRVLISILFSLFVTLQAASFFLGGNLIDYKFFEHLNIQDLLSVKDFFITEIVIGVMFFLLLTLTLFYTSRFIKSLHIKNWMKISVLILTLVGLSLPQGVVANIYDVVNIKSTKDKSLDDALVDLGINPSTYPLMPEIKATPGKNILVISLESLERGYLEPPMKHLTPNLTEIAQKHTYFDMKQNSGSKWTTASVYTTMTGFPSYFKSPPNGLFGNIKEAKIPSLGNILKKANYDTKFFMANKEFGGLEDMLSHFEFDVQSEIDFGLPKLKGFWGMHDKELFEQAKKQLSRYKKSKQPFALFISTISGHFPNGVYDKRMEDVLPKQPHDLEFMTSAVDYLVGDLFDHLKKEGLLESTVVYIYPDHLLMGSLNKVSKKFDRRRGLFLITTAPQERIPISTNEELAQIDLPRIILDGAGVKTNATFLTDYLKPEDKHSFIESNKSNILAFNEAAIKTSNFSEGITVSINHNNSLLISSVNDQRKAKFPNIQRDKAYTIYFDEMFRLTTFKPTNVNEAFKDSHLYKLIVYPTEDELNAYVKKGRFVGIAKNDPSTITFSKKELQVFKSWDKLSSQVKAKPDRIILKSTEWNSYELYGGSKVFTGTIPHTNLGRGINILYKKENYYTTKTFDTYSSITAIQECIEFIKNLLQEDNFFAIIVNDTAGRKISSFQQELSDIGLPILSNLKHREAYVGYKDSKNIIEQKDDQNVLVELPYNAELSPVDKSVFVEKSRFIAHAGGKIDGKTYTNSLEALNKNYQNGFRYFELDIVKTSDGKYVAAHDWKMWVKKTGFQGTVPPTHTEFLSQKIHAKYTPLDLPAINKWFKAHPDAILVSDKVNEPKEFSTEFYDKKKLMMELFSTKAFKEAEDIGLKGRILTSTVIKGIKKDKLKRLQSLGVKYIAVSRKEIGKNPQLYKDFKDAGIKTYLYHINQTKIFDEKYVANFELNYAYGLYADDWNFMIPSE